MLSKFGRVLASGRREAKWQLEPGSTAVLAGRAVGLGRVNEPDAVQVANPEKLIGTRVMQLQSSSLSSSPYISVPPICPTRQGFGAQKHAENAFVVHTRR